MKKMLCMFLTAVLILGLSACGGNGNAVFVQSVAEVTGMGYIAPDDRFPGVVVSENVTEIQKDADKSVAQLLVREGDDVEEGQILFSYDTDELQLALDKQRLELEQLDASIVNFQDQIKSLEAEKQHAGQNNQLQYTVEIQSLQVQLKEAELNRKAKQAEVEQASLILENADVVSPISGRIRAINENGTDQYGQPQPYITIQQAGSYRVKGTLGEQQLGGLMEGTRVKILSRMNDTQFWLGTVSLIDYENASQGSAMDMYYGMGSDEMTSSSKYSFFIELDDTTGLIMGQHVYIQADNAGSEGSGLQLPEYMVCVQEDGSAYVWAENSRQQLEKRKVTLGAYDEILGCYEILDGLTMEDYIAVPDDAICSVGAPTTHNYEEAYWGEEPEEELPDEDISFEDVAAPIGG